MLLFSTCFVVILFQTVFASKFQRRDNSLVAPFTGGWQTIGNTIMTPNVVKLTSDTRSMRGGILNYYPFDARDWEVQINFRVYGSTGTMFGDGFAFWYVKNGVNSGPALGGSTKFKGLGIFFDTYNNNQADGQSHTFPYISAMVSDGSVEFDPSNDGIKTQIGGCHLAFRNKPDATVAIIRYSRNTLEVLTEIGHSGNQIQCFKVDGVILPTGYQLGLTAETGDLSDNHDILFLKSFELDLDYSADELLEDRSKIEPSVSIPEGLPFLEPVAESSTSWSVFKCIIFLLIVACLLFCFYMGYGYYQSIRNQRKRLY